jgi:transcriptional regulator with XRE-family HTH domain
MTTEIFQEGLTPCVSVGGYRTESVPHLSQAFIDESGHLVVILDVQDIEKAGAVLPRHPLSWTDPKWVLFPSCEPEIFTRARETVESITDSSLSPSRELVQLMSHVPSLKYGRYRPITDDSSARLSEVLLELFGKLKNFAPSSLPAEDVVEHQVREPHQEALEWIKSATNLSWEDIGDLLGVSPPTVIAWRRGKPRTRKHRKHLFAVRDVLERAMRRNLRPSELAAWLDKPRGADGKTPADLFKAGEIGKARLLAITTPSPKVKMPQRGTQRLTPETYQKSRERVEAVPPEQDEEFLEMLDEDEE